MTSWLFVIVALLVIAAGASWQVFRIASRTKAGGRRSLRARRAEAARTRRDETERDAS